MNGYARDIDEEFCIEKRKVKIKDKKQIECLNSFFLNKISYNDIPLSFKSNKRFILELVSNIGLIFKEIEEIYKEDKDIILAAIKNNADVIYLLDNKFLYDRQFIKEILGLNFCCINRLPEIIAYDFEILSSIENLLTKHKNIYFEYFNHLEKCKREIELKNKIREKKEINLRKNLADLN